MFQPLMRVVRKRRVKTAHQLAVAEAQLGGFADASVARPIVQGQSATCTAQDIALFAQAVIEIGPTCCVRQIGCEARAQGREELLIRPDRRFRVICTRDFLCKRAAHQLAKRDVMRDRKVKRRKPQW